MSDLSSKLKGIVLDLSISLKNALFAPYYKAGQMSDLHGQRGFIILIFTKKSNQEPPHKLSQINHNVSLDRRHEIGLLRMQGVVTTKDSNSSDEKASVYVCKADQ